MSLNSVVNRLVRAAAGISQDISDAELDSHVAQLLAEEAKAKELKWSELGLTGLLGNSMAAGRDSPDPSLPKPNKRFLASVIRTVDGHNSALLRSQAEAAKQARNERMAGPSRPSTVGSSSRPSGGAASRLFGGAVKDMARNDSVKIRGREREHRGDERTLRRRDEEIREDGGRSSRYGDDRRDDKRYRKDDDRRSRDVDKDSRDSTRKSRNDNYDRHDGRHERRRDRSHERKDYGSDGDQSRHRSRDVDDDSERDRKGRKRRYDRNSRSPSPSKRRRSSIMLSPASKPPRELTPPPRSRDLSSSPSPPPVSKMDKYFESSYDPRLDLPAVPAQGLVAEVGWDNMLAILKERGKKKRRNSPSLSDDEPAPPPGILPRKRAYSPDTLARKAGRKERKAAREERRKRRGDSDSEDERERVKRRDRRKEKEKEKANGEQQGGGLPDGYEYTKKGSVREWDVGK
ncbi:uncharacterized protein IAS62_002541 [Cryptococcus decagattii]|uniref:Pre-mRNA-splicing factor 38 n=1 Tax=Cryptococcus decagattii TaxID=1859122 RepID=A0ABZ2ARZ2_9TREE